MVVEDEEPARALIVHFLEELQLCNPVVAVEDGERAIEVLSGQAVTPALILLDVQLPDTSGLEVLEWVRASPELSGVPVVMLTGSAELDDIDRAHQLGISSYLVKPVGFRALDDVLRKLGTPWMLLAPQQGA